MAGELKEIYASGDVEPHHCLSIIHPALPAGALHWVLGWDPLTVTLEDASVQVFGPAWFEVSLPQESATGQQQLQFRVGNVTGVVRRYGEQIRASGEPAKIIYRAYSPYDLTMPGRIHRMTASLINTMGPVATITASFQDAVNERWPREIYTQERFPGLRYYGG